MQALYVLNSKMATETHKKLWNFSTMMKVSENAFAKWLKLVAFQDHAIVASSRLEMFDEIWPEPHSRHMCSNPVCWRVGMELP